MLPKLHGPQNIRKSLFIVSLFLLSCINTSKKQGTIESSMVLGTANKLSDELKSFQITDIKKIELPGVNHISCGDKKSAKFLFSSAKRLAHNNAQIYEYNLSSEKENRITYQNGNALEACYHPSENYFIYSSTTDFEKENLSELFEFENADPEFSKPETWVGSKSDLYISSLTGDKIFRASFVDQTEAFAQYHPKSTEILYTSQRKSHAKIYRMNRFRKNLGGINEEYDEIYSLRISPSGKSIAWYAKSKDNLFQIYVADWPGKNIRIIETPKLLSSGQIDWLDEDLIVFSSKTEGSSFQELYSVSISNKDCFLKLAQAKSNIYSPNALFGNQLAFSIVGEQSTELILAKWDSKLLCPQPKASSP